MEAIRTKDKLFLAAVVPVTLVAAYAYLWRTDAVRRVAALEREDEALVTVADFPRERTAAERRLARAKAELERERQVPAPAVQVRAKADDSPAARERAVLKVFRQAGLLVEQGRAAERGDARGSDVLVRTGLCPAPVCRRYVLAGTYPQVCAALQTFIARKMAVIPDRVEMSAPRRWTLAIWL